MTVKTSLAVFEKLETDMVGMTVALWGLVRRSGPPFSKACMIPNISRSCCRLICVLGETSSREGNRKPFAFRCCSSKAAEATKNASEKISKGLSDLGS